MSSFFNETKVIPSSKLSKFEDLLDDNFILGELHDHEAPKQFFVENFAAFSFPQFLSNCEKSSTNRIMCDYIRNKL